MRAIRLAIRVIDSVSEWTGKATSWICIPLILSLFYESMARYVFDRPTIWSYETGTMLGLTFYCMGLAYVHKYQKHMRVDVVYRLLSPRGKAISDLVSSLILFFPLIIAVTITSHDWMLYAWQHNEILQETYWYPPAGPIRTVVFLGFSLFLLQGIAQLVRDIYMVIGKQPYD